MKRIAIFISGGGTNMQSIIDAVGLGKINGEVALVISSNAEAGGLARAKKHGIPSFVCSLKDFENASERDKRILELVDEFKIDLIVLAGYLGILSSQLIARYSRRIINIHPSLLPKFGGKGFFGLDVHRAVLEAGETESGASVHFVDDGIDSGKIIARQSVPVKKDDTPESLQQRVLKIEHELLVNTVANLCKD